MPTVTTEKLLFKAPSQVLTHPVPGPIKLATIAGTWTNVDHATRDLVKVVITETGSSITINAFGACSPTPCNWGAVAGISYAANVSSTAVVGFSAQYDFGFSKVILVAHLQGSELIVESYTEFTDGSGRSNYYFSNTMKK